MPSQNCLEERVQLVNQSIDASSYLWDFCHGDLLQSPEANLLNDAYGGYGTRVAMHEQNGLHYGFFLSGGTRTLFKLSFGSDILSNPVLTDLGNLGLNSNQLRAIEIVEDDGLYYGFVVESDKNKLYRIDFGNLLDNSPQNAVEIFTGTPLNSPVELTCVSDNGLSYLFIVNSGDGKVTRLKFNNSFAGSISDASALSVSGQWLNGVSFLKVGTNWHGIVAASLTSEVIKMDFVNGLGDNSPILTSIPVVAPMGVALVNENGTYYAFVQSRNASFSIFRINFGSSMSTPQSTNEIKNIGYGSTQLWGFSMYRSKSRWIALSTESGGSNIYRLKFPNNCFSDLEYSTDIEPNISTSHTGSYSVTLTAKDNSGNSSYSTQGLSVSDNLSSDINFLQQNICANNDVNFISVNNSNDIATYNWSFGDSQTSIISNPAHQYSSAGQYTVQLNVEGTNGCKNFTEKTIKIYDPPATSFTLPPGLICTNNEFTFTNTTTDNFDGNLSYTWLVNDVQKSNARDFKYAFNSEGDQQIKLKTSIPGCSNELTQTLSNIQAGPVVGFSFAGKCEKEAIMFTNESGGSISGYQWNFGNGNTSTQQNPSEIYSIPGNYNVSLVTSGTNGCASTLIKPVNIYSVPQTNFSLDLPPFSCSGSLSQFNDLTPPMPESNITAWAWSFGDLANGTSTQKNPLYTYTNSGDYAVSLVTTSNFGCSNSIQKTVTILPSPKADFSFDAACVNGQSTPFHDLSTGALKSWLWTIQSTTYSVQNPKHSYKTSGNSNALLTVTGTNNCISQISKNVSVPVPIETDFSESSTCANKSAVFDEINKGGSDPATNWEWYFDTEGPVSGSPASKIFTSTGNHTVTMKTTRQSKCTYSITKTIPIADAPIAKFTVFLEAGPIPFTPDITNESTLATSYLWNPGDPKQTSSQLYSPSFTYSQLGDYLIELEVGNVLGCKDHAQQLIHVVVPQINAAISDFKLQKIPGSENWSSIVTIENKSNVALIDPNVYLDISGNAMISEKVIGLIKPNASLTHTFTPSIVPRAVNFACAEIKVNSDEYQFDNRQCVNVDEQYISITPYPNPANNELILEWINMTSEPMDVMIYNESGQAIITRQYSPTLEGLNQVKVDVSNLSTGIYFVSYSVDGQSQNFRFSVIR